MTHLAVVSSVQQARERVAAEVRAEMARQRVSQASVRMALGLSQSAMSRRITGELAFDVGELTAIARLLGRPVTYFFPDEASAPPPNSPAPEVNPTEVTRRNNPCYSHDRVIVGPWVTPGARTTAA